MCLPCSECLNVSAECAFQSSQFVQVSAWLYHVLTHSTNWCVLQTTCHFISFTNNGLCCVMSVVYIGGAEGIQDPLLHTGCRYVGHCYPLRAAVQAEVTSPEQGSRRNGAFPC